jgi:preprotein translocase subunit SecG
MTTGFIILAVIAAVLLVLIILAQNPKGGIKNQLGAGGNVMGVKKTTDFLEKMTWVLAGVVILSSVAATKLGDTKKGNKEELDNNFKEAKKTSINANTSEEGNFNASDTSGTTTKPE